ncbi:unnamed protein product [Calicophoron daubneyi]|uniref:MARVEL domain-containing protein n=1 Tax=Calicophoron daubneyi TaxID=300641 RepID=A0AAV2T7B7_CALDB
MGANSKYASTIPGVFKLVESILDIITLILVSVSLAQDSSPSPNRGAGGWELFVSCSTLIISLFFYIIHLTNVIYKLAGPMTFIEFICILICGVFHLIAMIVAAATTNNLGKIIAAAVLYGINFAIYAIDSFFLFALYKVHGGYLNNPSVTEPAPVSQPGPGTMAPPMQPQAPPSSGYESTYSGYDNAAYAAR